MPVNLDFIEPLPASTNLDFGTDYTPVAVRRHLAWQGRAAWRALTPTSPQTGIAYNDPAALPLSMSAPWSSAHFAGAETSSLWKDKAHRPRGMAQPWDSLTATNATTNSLWHYIPAKHTRRTLPWDTAAPVGAALAANYRHPGKKHLARNIPWNAATRRNLQPIETPWGKLNRRLKSWIIPWNQGHRPSRIWPPPEQPPYIPPEPPPPCEYAPTPGQASLDLDEPLPASTRFEFWCTTPARPLVNRTLIMLPTSTLVKLPNREPIEAGSVSLDLDIDSWAWNLSATVPAASLALIQPDGSGPAEIEVNLSGHVWNILVESFAESREFGSAAYTVQGRSPAAYLAAPYAPARTWTQNNIRTAQQLAEEELLNTGWTLIWNTTDWLIPGGVFSYDNLTPLDAIGQIAASIGSVILPDASAKTLTIQPRYRFNVWSLSGAANNAVLDTSILTGLSLQWQPKPKYNGVYAAGQNQGVVVFTKRTGTSGSLLAPQVVDALLTTTSAGLERGRQILNAAGNKARVSLSLPLTNSGTLPGLMQPGYVVEIPETVPWKGIVTGVSISAEMDENGPSFQQQLEIERHYE